METAPWTHEVGPGSIRVIPLIQRLIQTSYFRRHTSGEMDVSKRIESKGGVLGSFSFPHVSSGC
eukprot:5727867-Amphidinium_carterae.2